ncbi:MAG: polyribonucleotide nucleotidyltransferase, partial [Cyanobacteria bacterium J06636_27]
MEEFEKSISFDGRDIRLKVGVLAPQAGGSVMIQSGDTAVLVTATRSQGREGIDFLPLTVDYEERLYAAGRIPGGILRREGRPPEKAILTSRLIDRPIRPLFPSWLRDDLQIIAATLSVDEQVPPDVLAVTGASIATLLAKIPFQGPMAAVRVGLVGDDFIINPTYAEITAGDLDLVVAGSPDGVIMVEAGANQLPEQDIIEAIEFGYEAVQDLIQAQLDLIEELGIEIVNEEPPEVDTTLEKYISDRATDGIKKILSQFDFTKAERDDALDAIKDEIAAEIEELEEEDAIRVAATENTKALGNTFKSITKKLMRRQIVEDEVRVDGRKLDEVRPVSCQVGLLPKRVHGSGLFNRGLTQVLSICTLGTPGDAQNLNDDLQPDQQKHYLHHYNFPPYSVGETKPLR